jgi:glycosyltransferase involved in cell wall biosynthesis
MIIVVAGPCSVMGLCPGLPEFCDEDHPSELVRSIVNGYLARGHSVEVVKFNRFATQPITMNGGPNVRVNLIPRRNRGVQLTPFFWWSERRAASAVIRRAQPDVVHAHWTYEYAFSALQSRFPSVITAHDVPTRLFRLMRPRYYWWPRLARGFLIAQIAPRMTAQSPHTLDCWKKELFRVRPIDLVLNPIATEVFNLYESKSTLSSPSFAASAVGFYPHKNTANLIEAFAIVRRGLPESSLTIFGDDHGPKEAAERWASDRGISGGIVFKGRTNRMEMLRHMAGACSVFVHPSREESFGMVIAEAMAMGLPTVGGKNSGAVPWLLDEGRAGVVCDVESPEDIACAMLEALARPELGPKGRTRIMEHCGLDQVVSTYLTILAQEAATHYRKAGVPT